MTTPLKHTPFYYLQNALNGKFVPFFGWEMPIQFKGIVDEHMNVRNHCGLFDVSHMGEIFVTGDKALEDLQHVFTNDLSKISDKRIIYSPMCYENGGIIDDVLIYQFTNKKYLIIANASNIDKDYTWIKDQSKDSVVENKSDEYAQLAIQGPKSQDTMKKLTDFDLSKLGSFHFANIKISGIDSIVSRTGYTGEDGFELYFSPAYAETIWNSIMTAGSPFNIMPIGLGARDTLRLEAGLMLYGNDIDDKTTPLEAPLKWTVSFDKEFIGKKSLLQIPPKKKLIGFELVDRGVARHGNEVTYDGKPIGVVTSGTFSPYFKKPIGLCYIPPSHPVDKHVSIKIHDKTCEAALKGTRFYRRTGK